ncbi:hypothetical protein JB92DRAFT_2840477 [Gautieria morchelliformis]|nr:hypothetical protein JB92DRAFT_2840477 [Gautieria morchelliformis]
MFCADAKAKRVAKMKNKSYRKIQRKRRERIRGLVKEAEGLDGMEDGEKERTKREVERATFDVTMTTAVRV